MYRQAEKSTEQVLSVHHQHARLPAVNPPDNDLLSSDRLCRNLPSLSPGQPIRRFSHTAPLGQKCHDISGSSITLMNTRFDLI